MILAEALLPLAVGSFLIAGAVKGLIGIGLPTALISILAQFTDPRTAIALLLIPSVVTNVWQIRRSRFFVGAIRQLWPFALVMTLGIWISARFAAQLDARLLITGTGAMIVLFVASNFIGTLPPIRDSLDRPIQVVAGAIAGLLGGLTAIWGPPMVIYLLARRVAPNEFIGMTGMLILVGSLPLLLAYWQAGLMDGAVMRQSAMMIAPTLAGFALGEWLRLRLDPAQFRRAVLIAFLLMGLNLLRKGLMG